MGKRIVWVVLLVGLTVFLYGCDERDSELLKSADRTVIEKSYFRNGSMISKQLEYGKTETEEIAKLVLAAQRHKGVYDTPVTLYHVRLFKGEKFLTDFSTCSDLFLFKGKKYRDKSRTLARLVDGPVSRVNEYSGLVATIRSLGSNSLSELPLQIEHTLRNTADKPIVIYELENSIIPLFGGFMGAFGAGPSGVKTKITLKPDESVSRWVRLRRVKPDKEGAITVVVRCEGTGFNETVTAKPTSSALKFCIGYDDKIFTGKTDYVIAPVLATPWIEIEVE